MYPVERVASKWLISPLIVLYSMYTRYLHRGSERSDFPCRIEYVEGLLIARWTALISQAADSVAEL
jgi:hypothetical protein